MTAFYINDDFPKSEIEFDRRFATEGACYDYLFRLKWPTALCAASVGINLTGLAQNTFTSARAARAIFL